MHRVRSIRLRCSYSLTASSPAYTGAAAFELTVNNLVLELRYLWIVEW